MPKATCDLSIEEQMVKEDYCIPIILTIRPQLRSFNALRLWLRIGPLDLPDPRSRPRSHDPFRSMQASSRTCFEHVERLAVLVPSPCLSALFAKLGSLGLCHLLAYILRLLPLSLCQSLILQPLESWQSEVESRKSRPWTLHQQYWT